MRISRVALGLVMLGGCHQAATIAVPEADRIECAVGESAFARTCAIERSTDGANLTLRNPNGGFHRLTVSPDGTIGPADGADRASGHPLADGRFEVEIGGDRYRLPPRK